MVEYTSLEAFENMLKSNTSKKVELKELGLKVDIPSNFQYYDDGAVNDLNEYMDDILKMYGIEAESYHNKVMGRCLTVAGDGDIHIHVATVPLDNYLDRANVKGHEETHALCRLGKLNILEETLREKGINTKTFYDNEEEVLADIGGMYALFNNLDYNNVINTPGEPVIKKMYWYEKDRGDEFSKALDWLQENSKFVTNHYKVGNMHAVWLNTTKLRRRFPVLPPEQ